MFRLLQVDDEVCTLEGGTEAKTIHDLVALGGINRDFLCRLPGLQRGRCPYEAGKGECERRYVHDGKTMRRFCYGLDLAEKTRAAAFYIRVCVGSRHVVYSWNKTGWVSRLEGTGETVYIASVVREYRHERVTNHLRRSYIVIKMAKV